MQATEDITQLLLDWSKDDRSAADKLMPLVYDEMRRLAKSYLSRGRANHTLQPTALVHEAYMRLIGQSHVSWQNRAGGGPPSAAASAMRSRSVRPSQSRVEQTSI